MRGERKLKRIFSIAIIIAIVLNLAVISVVATGTLSASVSERVVTIVFTGAVTASDVTITVIAPRDTLPAGPFVWHSQGEVNVTFTLSSAAPSGTYIVRASYDRVTHEQTFEFVNPALLAAVNGAANAAAVLVALETYGTTIDINMTHFMLMPPAYRLNVAQRIFNERGTGYANNAVFTQTYNVALALVSVQLSTPGNVGNFAFLEVLRRHGDVLGVNIGDANNDFNRLPDVAQGVFQSRMAGRNNSTIQAFQTAFNEQVLVAFFRTASWPGIQVYNTLNASSLLNFDYGARYLALTDRSIPLRAIVTGRNGIETVADINRLRNAAFDAPSTPGGSVGLGGGGGGGGGGGFSVNTPNDMIIAGEPPVATRPEALPPDYEPHVFNDLHGAAWAIDYITDLYETGIVNGVGDGMFAPNAQVTREQFLRMTVLAFDFDLVDEETGFSDVDNNAWYAPYVQAAVYAGIITGISETEFGVGLNISRQDLIVIIYRALLADGMEFDEAEELTFYDSYMIADYAVEALSVMFEIGIINGVGYNQLAPTANATRAQAARIIALAMWL